MGIIIGAALGSVATLAGVALFACLYKHKIENYRSRLWGFFSSST